MAVIQTAERITQTHAANNVIFQRHLVAYNAAAGIISGNVLEVGCGDGYGLRSLYKLADSYTAIDKFSTDLGEAAGNPQVQFIQQSIPPLPFADNTFDYVISFQVIEHIENDALFTSEIARVLKPGGKAIITTPNIKTTLTRNPFHVREYTTAQLSSLFGKYFSQVNNQGVFGNQKVMEYYWANKKSVERITRWDVLDLQHRLPRKLLEIPYDFFNWINRKRLLKENTGLVSGITADDHFIAPAGDMSFDHFLVATK